MLLNNFTTFTNTSANGYKRSDSMSVKRSPECHIVLRISFLACLGILFIAILNLDRFLWPAESYFQSPMTVGERSDMLQVLHDFHLALEKANVSYFMGGGTLIGSVRHHGPIPWDDDIDIYVKSEHKLRMILALNALNPRYSLYSEKPGHEDTPTQMWKFFRPASGRSFIHRPFTWPYVDIFFYQENSTHIWDEAGWYSHERGQIFPLIRRPFGELWLPAPCNSSHALADYRIILCQSRSFSHLLEVPIIMWRQRIVECSRLHRRFPFVFRRDIAEHSNNLSKGIIKRRKRNEDGVENQRPTLVEEELLMNGLRLQRVKIVEPRCTGIALSDDTNIRINDRNALKRR